MDRVNAFESNDDIIRYLAAWDEGILGITNDIA